MRHYLVLRTEAGGVLSSYLLEKPDKYGDFTQAVIDCLKREGVMLTVGDILEIKQDGDLVEEPG